MASKELAVESPVLTGIRIWSEGLDKIVSSLDEIVETVGEYGKKVEPYKERMAADTAMDEILKALPSEKTSLLISSLKELAEIFPMSNSKEADQYIAEAEEVIRRLRKVCADLHKALDA